MTDIETLVDSAVARVDVPAQRVRAPAETFDTILRAPLVR